MFFRRAGLTVAAVLVLLTFESPKLCQTLDCCHDTQMP